MSFNRFRAQLSCEGFMGCSNFDDFFNEDFGSFTLDRSNSFAYNSALKEDASDLFYKGILSLTEGINNFAKSQYSWGVVKCYYSIFYLLRTELAIRDVGLIRHRSIYYLEARDGAQPITKGMRGSNRSNYQGDHKATINYFYDLFSSSDILLSQDIEGLNSYQWLMKKREQIHYQEKHFNEPLFPQFLTYIDSQVKANNFDNLIREIITDTFVKTFQPEYATLAIPIKRALITFVNFNNSGVTLNITQQKLDFLKSISTFPVINL